MELKLVITRRGNPVNEVLIVPYGIETIHYRIYSRQEDSFNRTLWN